MSYIKTIWKARKGTNLNRFEKEQETARSVILRNAPTSIEEPGTPFSVDNMNKIEEGIEAAHELVAGEAAARILGDSDTLENANEFTRQTFLTGKVTVSASTANTEFGTSAITDTLSNIFLKIRQGFNWLKSQLANYVPLSQKGAANGIATLDENVKIPLSQMSDVILGQMLHAGTLNASTAAATLTANAKTSLGTSANTITLTNNTAAITGYKANQGNYYIVSTAGTFAGITFDVGDWLIGLDSKWDKIDNTDAVTSVAGRIGAVVLSRTDVGLGNVDNTSDTNKPISTAVQAALNNKIDVSQRGASDGVAPLVNGKVPQENIPSVPATINRTITLNDNSTNTSVSDTGGALTIPLAVQSLTAPAASNAQLTSGTKTLRSAIQTIINNIAHLFANKANAYDGRTDIVQFSTGITESYPGWEKWNRLILGRPDSPDDRGKLFITTPEGGTWGVKVEYAEQASGLLLNQLNGKADSNSPIFTGTPKIQNGYINEEGAFIGSVDIISVVSSNTFANNVTFPVGTYLLIRGARSRNVQVTGIRIANNNTEYDTEGAGAQVPGTWYSTGSQNATPSSCLVRRIA